MKELWNSEISHLKMNYQRYIVLVFLITGIYIGDVLIKYGLLITTLEKISYFGVIITSVSLLLFYIEFRSNHDWNRRKAAMTVSWTAKESTDKSICKLNDEFKYLLHDTTYREKADKIYSEIYEQDEKGNLVKENDKLVIKQGGYEIKMAIYDVLNTYEYLAVGAHHCVFDEAIITELFKGRMIKAFNFFNEYIVYMNKLHDERKGSIWVHFKALAEKMEAQRRKVEKVNFYKKPT